MIKKLVNSPDTSLQHWMFLLSFKMYLLFTVEFLVYNNYLSVFYILDIAELFKVHLI
jgi:hypothetical protein